MRRGSLRAKRVLGLLALSAALAALAVPAFAQTPPAPAPPPKPPGPPRTEPGRGYRAYVAFDQVSPAAKDSFEAVLGKTSFTAVGAGGELRFWKGLFARGAFSTLEETGSRVFVVSGRAVSVGIPLKVEMMPLEMAVGWRVPFGRSRRVVGYGGAGLLYLKYRETSDFASPGENTDDWFSGYNAFAGVDIRVWNWVSAGVEAQYRTVPDAFGDDGVAAGFHETDLGGTVIRFLVGIRR